MSTPDTISFLCPACSKHLTVPMQLAGVTGPCPSCQVLIQAPYQAAPSPPGYQIPVQQPATPQPPQPQYAAPPVYQEPPAEQLAPPAEESQPKQPTLVRPEPRNLPNRSEPVQAPTRVRSEPSGEIRPKSAGPPQQRHRRNKILRLLVPLIFIGLSLGVIYGVKTFLQKDLSAIATAPIPGGEGKRVKAILPEERVSTFEDLTGEDSTQSIPVGDPAMPDLNDPVTGFSEVDPGDAALKLLEDFLEMNTLEERLPVIETKVPEEELLSSVLNGPLPADPKITVDIRETNPVEQLVDYYYYVDFPAEDGGVNPQTMLVRTRGTTSPKVVVDPFLDLYGGRFEEYASAPTKEAGKFQVIVTAGAFCYDDIPNAEKKFTLKILPRDDSKEIAKAYFGKASNIAKMLEDETSGLAFGQAKACTVFLRWNMDDDPQRPFLEALDIISLDWNP